MNITPEYLYQRTLAHLSRYKQGTHPYQQWKLLQLLVALYKPERVLDLGTAIGLTAVAIAQANPKCIVDTVDMELINIEQAKIYIDESNLSSRIFLHHSTFQDHLKSTKQVYDMIFFDGFNLDFELIVELESKLKDGGFMVLANLWQKKKNPVVDRLLSSEMYEYSVFFEDTILAIKSKS